MRTMKMLFVLLAFLTVEVQMVLSLYTPGCSDVACAAVYIPPECRFPTFAIENGHVCRLCDVNICNQLPPIFERSPSTMPGCMVSCKMVDTISRCPNIACPAVYIPPECRLHTFLIYNGYVCRACDQDVCRFG